MGSQFADINADGSLDYITATFDGSPHVSYGSIEGFREPVRLKDVEGRRLLISSIWDYEKEKHVQVGWAMPDGKAVRDRCISALAFDWDNDGDHDLLLGSYEMGRLFVQMNEGSNKHPKYTGKNIPVMAGGKPWALPGKMTTPRLTDWDGDGDMDLVAGTFGDAYNNGGGGVYLSLNEGKPGAPQFSSVRTLIEPTRGAATAPTRPDAGLYPEVVDWDGDGDLDLIVGGYSMWKPAARKLTSDEEKILADLRRKKVAVSKEMTALMAERSKAMEKATAGIDPSDKEKHRKVGADVRKKFAERNREIFGRMRKIDERITEYQPSKQRRAFVWFYERLGSPSAESAAAGD